MTGPEQGAGDAGAAAKDKVGSEPEPGAGISTCVRNA